VLACIATSSFAQVKVDSIGRVTNGDTLNVFYSPNPTPRGQGSLGEQTTILAYGDYNYGMAIRAKTSASWGPALFVSSQYYYDRQVAIMASASNAQPQDEGRSYGIIASAGNCTPRHNYGVVGNILNSYVVVEVEDTGSLILRDNAILQQSSKDLTDVQKGGKLLIEKGQILIP